MSRHAVVTTAHDAELAAGLAVANIPTLLMSLVHLTGERRWLEAPYAPTPPKGLDDNDSGGLPIHIQAEIRARALHELRRHRDQPRGLPALPAGLDEMMACCVGEPIGSEFTSLLRRELDLEGPRLQRLDGPNLDALIVGAGASGICAGVELARLGVNFTIVDKNDGVGGTWLENRYPGCGCDSPTHLYSFSFAPNAGGWDRYYESRTTLRDYLDRCVDEQGLRPHLRLSTRVLSAAWDETAARWTVELEGADGARSTVSVAVLISATGQFNKPKLPAIDGLDTFDGPVAHSAQWPDDLDVTGKRVAVIGTGASAMQIVPAIAGVAADVAVFQRTAQWAMPNPNYKRSVEDATRVLMDQVPFYAVWYRLRLLWNFGDRLHPALQVDPTWARKGSVNRTNESVRKFLTSYIRSELGDRADDLMAKVVPDYPPFAKRMLMDNSWFRTVARDDVQLVTDPIDHVDARGVVTSDGRHDVDVVVLATGFDTTHYLAPINITGRNGQDLHDTWGSAGPRAQLGVTVPGFPNLFMLYGPNTNPHGGSVLFFSEMQARHIAGLIEAMLDKDIAAIDCRAATYETYNRSVDEAHDRMVWSLGEVDNYFRNETGRIVTNIPWRLVDYWNDLEATELTGYELITR